MAPNLVQVFKDGVTRIRQAFPDYGGTNEAQVAEREQVTNRFGFCGAYRGEFEDVAPPASRSSSGAIPPTRWSQARSWRAV
jgi:predicted ester cyclase